MSSLDAPQRGQQAVARILAWAMPPREFWWWSAPSCAQEWSGQLYVRSHSATMRSALIETHWLGTNVAPCSTNRTPDWGASGHLYARSHSATMRPALIETQWLGTDKCGTLLKEPNTGLGHGRQTCNQLWVSTLSNHSRSELEVGPRTANWRGGGKGVLRC